MILSSAYTTNRRKHIMRSFPRNFMILRDKRRVYNPSNLRLFFLHYRFISLYFSRSFFCLLMELNIISLAFFLFLYQTIFSCLFFFYIPKFLFEYSPFLLQLSLCNNFFKSSNKPPLLNLTNKQVFLLAFVVKA